jgi:Tol biopolymer transport system component
VLYEMLTGRPAFSGHTISDVIVAILERDPDWAALPPSLPSSLQRLMRRCVEKDPKRRLRDIGDALLDVNDALTGSSGAGVAGAALVAERRPTWRIAGLVSLAAVLATAAAVALAIPFFSPVPQALPETRVEIVTPPTSDPHSFALSPDGRQIVFVASGDGASRLWLRSLASTTAQPLAGTEGAAYPFWSPDSRSVAFFADSMLKRFDIGGGTPQTLAMAGGGRGGAWNADGVILFARNPASPVSRVAASGGEAVAVTTLDRQTGHQFPVFLPDGRHFLFFATGAPDTGGIYLGALDSDATTRLTPAETRGVYLQTSLAQRAVSGLGPAEASSDGGTRRAEASSGAGWLAWVRDGTLVAQRLDLDEQALTGDPVTLAGSVSFEANSSVSAVSAAAPDQLAYRAGGTPRRQLTWFDRSGKELGTWGAPDDSNLSSPRLSPDGRRVAVWRTVQGNVDIWLMDGARMSRVTFDAAFDRFHTWSPDGSRIAFGSNRKGPNDLYYTSSSGAGAEQLLVESPQTKVVTDWSADGRFLLYYSVDPQTAGDFWVLPTEGERKPWVFLKTPFQERNGQFSPDGRWVAYQSNESGRHEIYIRPFVMTAASGSNPEAGRWQVSTAGGVFPRWRSDGRELYYLGPDGALMAAPVAARATTIEPGEPVPLFRARIFGGGVDSAQGGQYDVARDGRFLINTVLDDASSPITLILNWRPPAE